MVFITSSKNPFDDNSEEQEFVDINVSLLNKKQGRLEIKWGKSYDRKYFECNIIVCLDDSGNFNHIKRARTLDTNASSKEVDNIYSENHAEITESFKEKFKDL